MYVWGCASLQYNTRSNDLQFMHKLYLSFHTINRMTGGHRLHCTEKLKVFTE